MTKMRLAAWLVLTGFAAEMAAGDAVLSRFGRVNTDLIVTEQILGAEGPYAERDIDRYEIPRDIDRAIAELKEHLGLLGDGEVEVIHIQGAKAVQSAAEHAADGRAVIVLGGRELDRALHKSILDAGDDPESFALRVENGVVTVLGLTPKAVLNGVYELLEQTGFRWYMPGEFGRVIPKGHIHVLRAQQTFRTPSFEHRYSLFNGLFARQGRWDKLNWLYRVRHGSIGRISAGHGTRGVTRNMREEHPEWFALIDGERGRSGQLCVSNPGLLDMLTEHWREYFSENPDDRVLVVSPDDGYRYCECEDCLALDTPGLKAGLQQPMPSMTDRYVWLINQLIDRLADDFTGLQVPFMAYAGVMDPPVRHKPDQRAEWSVGIANIHECRLHGSGNPNCPETRYTIWLNEKWGELVGFNNIRSSGYHWNLAAPGVPFMMISRIRDEVPVYYQLGSRRLSRVVGIQHAHWGMYGPAYYLAAKLAWNIDTDVDALLDEFFKKFYGPASGPMAEYTMLLDRALYEANYHTGSGWDMIHIYDEPVRRQARAALRRAERRVGLRPGLTRRLVSADRVTGENELYALRVEVAAKGWDYFEEFANIMESRRRHDFHESMAALERARELARSMAEDYEYRMFYPVSLRYLNIFFGGATEAGYECLSDGGELVAGLDSKWEFMLEPQGIGERIGLHDPYYTGGNWQSIDTHHSWSTQGMRYYFGEAWYRQKVKIPASAAGKRVNLWFSGVDRGARVWLNGELLGTSPGTEFDIDAFGGITRPFEFDATAAMRPGRENVVVVRTIRDICNELGTGGLRDVAMFYAPAEEERRW